MSMDLRWAVEFNSAVLLQMDGGMKVGLLVVVVTGRMGSVGLSKVPRVRGFAMIRVFGVCDAMKMQSMQLTCSCFGLCRPGALGFPREFDGACFQMRLSYSPVANIFLFLFQWADCQLVGAIGLLRILIYKTYANGKTTVSVHERKASIREFYGDTVPSWFSLLCYTGKQMLLSLCYQCILTLSLGTAIIFPSLLQLQGGITDVEDRKQKKICSQRYTKKVDLLKGKLSEVDIEREAECGICMEINTMVVLPICSHSLCLKCYQDWHRRSQSCPFCRCNLKQVKPCDLWICTSISEVVDLSVVLREDLQRLFMYIEKLPLIVPDPIYASYDLLLR
ncbi:hypothetical protein RJ639_032864 [Escallonia herrerae]|uniref:RING-type domain-containing protein n=1 Tax=Escallonia herrerae TaxID=1293975 RepID=A0AA88WXU6_9ASTE|nr:hypothetical protein RJ639_032864 [Escallonia herrerae]